MSLFDASPIAAASERGRQAPLAERMRPRTLDEYVGQDHLLAPGKPLRLAIESDDATSMVFWGPPGDRQNHACKDHRANDPGQLHRIFGSALEASKRSSR